MLTRLRVKGFKNLKDVEVYFGPLTCIAGPNAVGKSNLLDAITFLSALADDSLVTAAMGVRDEGFKSNEISTLLFTGGGERGTAMSFDLDMIIPPTGRDDLGQEAEANITFLSYKLELSIRKPADNVLQSGLEIQREALDYIRVGDAQTHLPFLPAASWRKSVIKGRRTSPFISTQQKDGRRTVQLHQDGSAGRPREFDAGSLPRTVLSSVNASESPTALLAKREMQSWRLLQLEPSQLRASDRFTDPASLSARGAHLPATLFRLCSSGRSSSESPDPCAWISNRVSQLVGEIRSVRVQRDNERQLLTVVAEMSDGTEHPARSLSDGTLRFLALATLEADPAATGVLCLEEPENGIHPERVPAMLQLLADLAVDPSEPVDETNPLRQVIVTTHSPLVAAQVRDSDIVFAQRFMQRAQDRVFGSVEFLPLTNTWRSAAQPQLRPVSTATVGRFLQPLPPPDRSAWTLQSGKRVADRKEFGQLSLPIVIEST